MSHYHSQTAASFMDSIGESSNSSGSKSDTGSKSDSESNKSNGGSNFSGSEASNVSDMSVDIRSRFEHLNKQRRKSGGSDYQPESDSNNESASKSKSETDSEESGSENCIESIRLPSFKNKVYPIVRGSDEDSEGTSSRSTSRSLSNPAIGKQVKLSPVVRKSPLGLGPKSSPSKEAMMRGYRYSMLPSRTATMNVNYSRYLVVDEDDDSDDSLTFSRNGKKKGRRKQVTDSDSEFEIPGINGDSSEEEASLDESSDEYYPTKRRAGGSRRRKVRTPIWFCGGGGGGVEGGWRGRRRGEGGSIEN